MALGLPSSPRRGESPKGPRTRLPFPCRNRGRALSLRSPLSAFFGADTSLAGQVVIRMTDKRRFRPFRGCPASVTSRPRGGMGTPEPANFIVSWLAQRPRRARGSPSTPLLAIGTVEIERARPIRRTQSHLPPGASEQTRFIRKVRKRLFTEATPQQLFRLRNETRVITLGAKPPQRFHVPCRRFRSCPPERRFPF